MALRAWSPQSQDLQMNSAPLRAHSLEDSSLHNNKNSPGVNRSPAIPKEMQVELLRSKFIFI